MLAILAFVDQHPEWKSKHFPLLELLKSETAERCHIINVPDESQLGLLQQLVTELLDPLRGLWGDALSVTSGFRCTKLNRMTGGSSVSSDHMCLQGAAADLTVNSPSRSRLISLMRMCDRNNLPFDQMILYPGRVHFGWRPDGKRRYQVLENMPGSGKREMKI